MINKIIGIYKLKKKQIQILVFLYRFRFLNRIQIQQLLGHKKFNQVILWLNDLTEKKYIRRYYDKRFASQPAVYSLDTEGRKYLKKNVGLTGIAPHGLDRVWKEYKYTNVFRKHCMFTADIYLSLLSLVEKNESKLHFYSKVDIKGMRYMLTPEPDSYFSIEEKTGTVKRYFLDTIDAYPQRDDLKKRVWQYLHYFDNNSWQKNTGYSFPEVIIVTRDSKTKKFLNGYIRYTLIKKPRTVAFFLSTWGEIKAQGIKKEVLHRVELKKG